VVDEVLEYKYGYLIKIDITRKSTKILFLKVIKIKSTDRCSMFIPAALGSTLIRMISACN